MLNFQLSKKKMHTNTIETLEASTWCCSGILQYNYIKNCIFNLIHIGKMIKITYNLSCLVGFCGK